MEFEWEKLAMSGEQVPPAGLSYSERILYSAFCVLYFRYKNGMISREEGAREKRKLISEHEMRQSEEDSYIRSMERDKKISQAVWEYRKNRTLENADNLVLAIDGIGINEDRVVER